jgi:hypothetical protein
MGVREQIEEYLIGLMKTEAKDGGHDDVQRASGQPLPGAEPPTEDAPCTDLPTLLRMTKHKPPPYRSRRRDIADYLLSNVRLRPLGA